MFVLVVIALGVVPCAVIPRIHYLKILWPIVGRIVVDMVDNLITSKRTANLKPCYNTVQPLLIPIDGNENVALLVDGARAFFPPRSFKPSIAGEPQIVGVAVTPAVATGIGAVGHAASIHTATIISQMCSKYDGLRK